MSRIGNKLITIPAGVTIDVAAGNEVTVKGPKGTLTKTFSDLMEIKVDGNVVTVKRPNDEKHTKQLHGTTRALLNNMVVGVSQGYEKDLKIIGIGYRTAVKGNTLTLTVGYSHPVDMAIPEGLEVTCLDKAGKTSPTDIQIKGIDKQLVGQFAAEVRAVRKPEPYKGKGIRYVDEFVRRKEGKTAGKK